MSSKLLFIVNDADFFVSHRLPIAVEASRRGYDVHVAAHGEFAASARREDLTLHPLGLSRSGMNPVAELASLLELYRLIRRLQPDLVHLVTIKPVLYGGIAARAAGVPGVVSAVSGLGTVFQTRGLKARALRALVGSLYRLATGHPNQRIIFQNTNDRATLVEVAGLEASKTVLVRGSGVPLDEYQYVPEPEGTPVVAYAARLLKDKGVVEFVDAARTLRARGVSARFWLIGDADPGNPETVTEAELRAWRDEGVVELLGFRRDIPSLFAQASIVSHPSYYGEGLPKVLAEAAACGRAVVTTDHPGCRDAIVAGETGLLVPPRDVRALADALERLILDPGLRQTMGTAGRQLAEQAFAIERIVADHLEIYDALRRKQR